MSKYNPMRDIMIGLEIFRARGGHDCGAEHDVFLAAQPNGVALSPTEVKRLLKHGWFIMSELCSGCADEPGDDSFSDPDEPDTRHLYTCTGWARFV